MAGYFQAMIDVSYQTVLQLCLINQHFLNLPTCPFRNYYSMEEMLTSLHEKRHEYCGAFCPFFKHSNKQQAVHMEQAKETASFTS
ncbi:hypothetical protein T03_14361 [Trichinella britovi]|uniref:Uncharacterized protein n=1 Tax=Trichinella britovi TaxID=45882 RepID=A0A0V1CPI7_TRIBR|nr:hypothetical protein T03_14361 [Trichinella britovi]